MIRIVRVMTLGLGLLLLTAQSASAHPGHAREIVASDSAAHYFVQPEHALVWVVALLAAAVLWGKMLAPAKEAMQSIAGDLSSSGD